MRLIRASAVASGFLFSIVLAGCGGGGGSEPTVGPPAIVSAVSGATAAVIAGTTTPIPLVAKVADANGNAVSGVSVTWASAFGSISPGTATTDANGQTTAQWTPGTVAGSQGASASVSGVGTATFSVTVAAAALAKLKFSVDTVKMTSIGQTVTVNVAGSDAFNNFISATGPTITIDDPTVATVAAGQTSAQITAVAVGTTTVRATQGTVNASAIVVVGNPCSGVTMTLAVGESQTLTGTAANQFCINGSAGAEFVAVPFYATGLGGTGSGQSGFVAAPTLRVTLTPLVNTTVSGPPTPSVGSNTPARTSVAIGGEVERTRDVAWEARFRERVRKQFSPLIASARNRKRQSSGARLSLGVSPDVQVNDEMQLNVDVDSACTKPILVSARVQAVSTHAIVVEDSRDPVGFTAADYQSFAGIFDSQIWTVDTDNFGVPTDIDKNGRVILFFTRAVNELTPENSTSFVGGFFFGRDLLLQSDRSGPSFSCPSSNQGEMFYLLAPDPAGVVHNNKWSVDQVKRFTAGTIAHEFQHLINFGYRWWDPNVNFSSFEETFLDEGLAHEAEELNYYAATGRAPRSNIEATTLINPSDSYLSFGNQNAVRFRNYLTNPDKYPPYSGLADTSLAVRGGIWSFLRYAADRRNSTVPERTSWSQLVKPTTNVSGLNNLKEVFGTDILSQMRDWSVANYLDDALSVSTPQAFQNPSWNTRSVETYVNGTNQANGTVFPLKVTALLSARSTVTLADGGAAYFRFGVNANAVGGATVSSSVTLPSTFSITIVRTK